MKNKSKVISCVAVVLTFGAILGGCSNSKSSDPSSSPETKANPNRIVWERVSKDNNPRIESKDFALEGSEKLKVDLFSFDRDVELTYSNTQMPDVATLKVYTVFRESASFGTISSTRAGRTLSIGTQGMYQCSIKTENGDITALKGGCYVRIEVILAVGSKVEVYNAGKILSKRFIPITTDELISNLNRASFDNDKLEVIEQFLSSYTEAGKTPVLSAKQLGQATHEFSWKEQKFTVLRKLHQFVSDRNNLEAMISDEFSYFDREEARRIVGI